jgi:signal transduction histidine kinase
MANAPATETAPVATPTDAASPSTLTSLTSFRVVYLAIFAFLLLYVSTVAVAETWLTRHFAAAIQEAVQAPSLQRPIFEQISSHLGDSVQESAWVSPGGVKVSFHVFGANGRLLYLNGVSVMPAPTGLDPDSIRREAEQFLPAAARIDAVSVPIDSLLSGAILVVYAAVLLQGLFIYNARVSRRQRRVLSEIEQARDLAALRTDAITQELESVRQRLSTVVPAEKEHAEEVRQLQGERENLQRQLTAVAAREEELRGKAAQAINLDRERQALEDLLDEAAGDLESKNSEIRDLEKSLKRASKGATAKAKESDLLARRLRTLYKTVEIDDRAVNDMVALRDESMKLKAEEAIKRLADDAENVAVRRKVGGLPPYLSIFELGFAGKGRVYYTKGRQRRFRVLTIGAKNSQKTDLEYLSRLDRSEMT